MDAILSPAVEAERTADSTIDTVSRLISGAFSGALTGIFAMAGAFTGAVTGAVAGRAAHYGVLRGAALGAVAGAILSVEVLEASRAYWYLELSGSRGPSSMADFLEQLFRGRPVDEQLMSTMLHSHHWQLRISDVSYEERDDVYGELEARGLSGDSLRKLPCYIMSSEMVKRTSKLGKSHEIYRDVRIRSIWFVLINGSSDMGRAPFADKPLKIKTPLLPSCVHSTNSLSLYVL